MNPDRLREQRQDEKIALYPARHTWLTVSPLIIFFMPNDPRILDALLESSSEGIQTCAQPAFLSVGSGNLLFTHDLCLDRDRQQVFRNGKVLKMPQRLFDLLLYFMLHQNRVLKRKQLYQDIWGPAFMGKARTLDAHIRWLRLKIEPNPDAPLIIQTVRGVGYRFNS